MMWRFVAEIINDKQDDYARRFAGVIRDFERQKLFLDGQETNSQLSKN